MLPNFLVIGSQKAGTTSLWSGLRAHPQIFMPDKKEVNYFFLAEEYAQGLSHYARYFDPAPADAIAVGEASPGYICHPAVAGRLYRAVPDAKLILTVRNPIDRAYSQYWDARRQLAEPRTFEATIEAAMVERYYPGISGHVSRGVYIQYIRDFLELFPREQLHIIVFDDLKRDPSGTYRTLFEFLGVDPTFEGAALKKRANPAATWSNPLYRFFFDHPEATQFLPKRGRRLLRRGPKVPFAYPPMRPETRARLAEFYRPWNAKLEAFLDRPLGWDN